MINRKGKPQTANSVQELQNDSFDREFNVNAVELLAYDPVANALRRVTTDAMNYFGTNNIDKNANGSVYEGLEDSDGNWQIVSITTVGTITTNQYANIKNNPSYTNYTDAWTARESLAFENYGEAF